MGREDKVGLDVYFRRDIANVLRATACASDGSMGMAIQLLGDPELCHQLDAAGIPHEKLHTKIPHSTGQSFHFAQTAYLI